MNNPDMEQQTAGEAIEASRDNDTLQRDLSFAWAATKDRMPTVAAVIDRARHRLAFAHPQPTADPAARKEIIEAIRGSWFAGRGSPRQYDSEAVEAAWERKADKILALATPSIPADSEGLDEYTLGKTVCHCSEDDGVPDVGITIGLGNGSALWVGELLKADGANVGFVFHGPNRYRRAVGFDDIGELIDLFRHNVGPALSTQQAPARAEG